MSCEQIAEMKLVLYQLFFCHLRSLLDSMAYSVAKDFMTSVECHTCMIAGFIKSAHEMKNNCTELITSSLS